MNVKYQLFYRTTVLNEYWIETRNFNTTNIQIPTQAPGGQKLLFYYLKRYAHSNDQ